MNQANIRKRLPALLMACLMFAVSTAGCSSSAKGQKISSAASQTDKDSVSTAADNKWFKKYNQPITITTELMVPTNFVWKAGDNPNSNGLTRWFKSHMNIQLVCSWTAPDYDTEAQKLDLQFASGNLPDVIEASPSQIAKFAAAGKLKAIQPLIDKYASPLVKYGIQNAQSVTKNTFFNPVSYKGTAYALPIMSDTLAFWWQGFVRKDILNDLGLQVPQTVDELENAFAAYKAKYPNGIAFAMDNQLKSMAVAMAPYQAAPGCWVKKDGKLVYGSIQPETKQGLTKLAEWYKKGYIDHEFVTKTSDTQNSDVAQGKVFSLWTAWSAIGGSFQNMWKNNPQSDFTVMPYLKGSDGNTAYTTQTWFTTSRAITSNCKYPEALIYMLNENWDSYNRNDQNIRAEMQKVGYTFHYPVTEVRDAVNKAQVEKDPTILSIYDYPDELTGSRFFNDYTDHYSWMYGLTGTIPQAANELFGEVAQAVKTGDTSHLSADAKSTYDGWGMMNRKMLTTFSDIDDYWSKFQSSSSFRADAFSGAPTSTMAEKQAYLNKLENETFTKIIMGTLPVSAFDSFVSDWNKNGGAQITKEVNEWAATSSK